MSFINFCIWIFDEKKNVPNESCDFSQQNLRKFLILNGLCFVRPILHTKNILSLTLVNNKWLWLTVFKKLLFWPMSATKVGINLVFRGRNYKKLSNDYEKVEKQRKELLKHYFWLCSGPRLSSRSFFNLAPCSNCSIANYVKLPMFHFFIFFFETVYNGQSKMVNVNY